jgi:hypothetical protein
MKTPDDEVASRIIERLRKEKFLSESALAKLQLNLTKGKLSAEDWKLIFDVGRPDKDTLINNEDQ